MTAYQNDLERDKKFQRLYEQYGKVVYHIALFKLMDSHAAQDIVQETFTRLYAFMEKIDDKKNIKYMIVTTSKNLIYDHLKREGRYATLPVEEMCNECTYQDIPHYLSYDQIIAKFSKYINDQELQVIILHYIDELPFREVARIMHMTTNQITGIKSRAVAKIKKHYKLHDFYY